MKPVYGLVTNGTLLGIGTLDEVIAEAKKLPGDTVVADGLQKNDESGGPQSGVGMVQAAMRAAALPDVTAKTVNAMSIDEAHSRLRAMGITGATPADMDLLSDNTKMRKSLAKASASEQERAISALRKRGSFTDADCKGVNLMPYDLANKLGAGLPLRTLCVGSSAACRDSCLVYTGQNSQQSAVAAKKRKLVAMYREPVAFLRMLVAAIDLHMCRCNAAQKWPLVRLNLLSDIPWEVWTPWLFEQYSRVQFYDYTKVFGRKPPPNYDLTFSYSGGNETLARRALDQGMRIAVVFVKAGHDRKGEVVYNQENRKSPTVLPTRFWGHQVVDADTTDIRPLDPPGVVCGLRWKINTRIKGGNEPLLISSVARKFVTPLFQDEQSGAIIAPESPVNHENGDVG